MARVVKIGDNSLSSEVLKTFFERIDKLEEEKAEISTHLSGVWAEAKSTGFDIKAMKQVHRLRKLDSSAREEHVNLVDLYASAIDIFS